MWRGGGGATRFFLFFSLFVHFRLMGGAITYPPTPATPSSNSTPPSIRPYGIPHHPTLTTRSSSPVSNTPLQMLDAGGEGVELALTLEQVGRTRTAARRRLTPEELETLEGKRKVSRRRVLEGSAGLGCGFAGRILFGGRRGRGAGANLSYVTDARGGRGAGARVRRAGGRAAGEGRGGVPRPLRERATPV